ncbi:mechanosensitive ion channel [Aureibaculum sp. 2210JD6-5]|uniref:mechanosensitive ion channel family protein n=1 Tax=Aureibaculum sp. 2210JD6-5 TaxID=3103957 RepID=UPI002AAC9BDA|nr:mechanosensitive ion channel domain-containing protein [Aureibaculum sp. 2210JD6-5]MDY7395256.1 mechanosensitive ion channel [Aureibaculum sp. 2210JD6-5]
MFHETMDKINEILNETIRFSDSIAITYKGLLIVLVALFITALVLKWIRKLVTRKLPPQDKVKFISLFTFGRWFIYLIILIITFDNIGVNVTALFTASAALLIGIGLALQTLFQDIISGVFILVDQSVHVGDIIELDGKVGRVEEIKLRTTRAVTVDNKVLVIPNHLYLTNSLYNWTANGIETRETVDVGVAYGSDVKLVESLLLQAAKTHPAVLKEPEPKVLFMNFGDSSLDFRVAFSINDSFNVRIPKSDIRFEIDKLFRENNVTIPFPQRDVHLVSAKSEVRRPK